MSRHPYFIIADLLACARQFRMHETRLGDPVHPANEFPINGPVFEIE
jgi:hypothetical protein